MPMGERKPHRNGETSMSQTPDPAILAIIPAYNEAAHIGAVVTAARGYGG